MASKSTTSLALFLALNLLFFSLVTAQSKPPPPPHSTPTAAPTPSLSTGTCSRDVLKLGVCGNLLPPWITINIGNPPVKPCCSLIGGLVDLEAAVCLCTAIRANVLNIINLNAQVAISLLLNHCGRNVPSGFQCP